MNITKLLSLLQSDITSISLIQTKLIHQKIITLGLQNDVTFCKALINLYFSRHNHHHHAKLIFQSIGNPVDISLWNSLISNYAKNFMFIEAIELYDSLLRYPFSKPDCYTYPSVLKACGALGRCFYGKMVHAQLEKTGFVCDVFVSSSLVGMYAKCGVFEFAVKVFDEMTDRDVACWNTVISCYYQNGEPEKSLCLFDKMKGLGFEPNSVTLTVAISCCGRVLDLERGKKIHEELVRNRLVLDDYVKSALVDMYGKCGCLEIAREIFEEISRKNVLAWNSMISAYVSKGDSKSCIELLSRMTQEGMKPTVTTLSTVLLTCTASSQLRHGKFVHGYIIRNRIETDTFVNNSLIDLYFKCSTPNYAEILFKDMKNPDVVSWNVMISGFITSGKYFEALEIYNIMQKSGVKPDAITFTTVLPACSCLAALEKSKEIHKDIIDSNLEKDELVMGALLDTYAKCGDVDEARRIFSLLPEKDFVSTTSMITAFGSHGRALEAVEVFNQMLKLNTKPDEVTFLAILSACSHGGLIDEGWRYFNEMPNVYGINPRIEHYSCLIDLLSRAGKVSKAYSILKENPEIKEDVGLLSTILSGCCMHSRNYELGEEIANLLMEKDPDDPSTCIVLSNMYASVNRWDEVWKIRVRMKRLGLRKNPGCSWIEIDKIIQSFFAEDKSHPKTDAIYTCLNLISYDMEEYELQSS